MWVALRREIYDEEARVVGVYPSRDDAIAAAEREVAIDTVPTSTRERWDGATEVSGYGTVVVSRFTVEGE